MSNKLSGLLGLLILLAGGAGLYLFSRQAPGGEEEAEEAAATVVPVQVGQIQRMTLHDYLWTYGSVIANPGIADTAPAAARVSSPRESIVTQVHCAVGDQVKQGQVLFSLYERLASLTVEQAEQTLRFAEENFRRQAKLQQVQGTSAKLYLEAQQQFDDARNALSRARAELEMLKVTAPFDGTIMAVDTTVGETVAQGGALAQLTDLTRLMVKAGVPAPQAEKLRVGQGAEIEVGTSTASPEPRAATQTGRLDFIDRWIDPNDNTVSVLIGLPPDTSLRPGQFVRVRITAAEYRDRLAVPNESVVTTPEGQTVVAIVQGDEAVPTPVTRGVREGDWVEVEGAGLEAGMDVVTVGAYGLPGRTKIRVMEQQPATAE
jgi:membrane fusion protein (multidrug efflux system)